MGTLVQVFDLAAPRRAGYVASIRRATFDLVGRQSGRRLAGLRSAGRHFESPPRCFAAEIDAERLLLVFDIDRVRARAQESTGESLEIPATSLTERYRYPAEARGLLPSGSDTDTSPVWVRGVAGDTIAHQARAHQARRGWGAGGLERAGANSDGASLPAAREGSSINGDPRPAAVVIASFRAAMGDVAPGDGWRAKGLDAGHEYSKTGLPVGSPGWA